MSLLDVISAESLRVLVGVFGSGRSIRVPSSTATAGRFEILIGIEQTARLISAYAGTQIYLPGLPPPDGRERGPTLRKVLELSEAGKSALAIAQASGCSVRTIYGKRARIKKLQREGKWK